MKSYKIFYTKASGLNQVGDLQAYCYELKDGFVHFYYDEEHKTKDLPFKSINKDAVMYVGDSSAK